MSNLLFLYHIFLSYKVFLTGCEVVLVNRNITDSFRVGKDGCVNNTGVCPSFSTCQTDSGLCLCTDSKPSFRNPNDRTDDGQVYGCMTSHNIRSGGGGTFGCSLKPLQLVPYSHEDPAAQFSESVQNISLKSCSLMKAWSKFPNQTTDDDQTWLKESYVNLTALNGTLYFKWKRSVPGLRGSIITLRLNCQQVSGSFYSPCLRAKVLGIWPPDANPAIFAPTITNKPNETKSSLSTGTQATSIVTTTMLDMTTPAPGSKSPNLSSDDDDSGGIILVVAVAVPVVLLIVVVVVLWLLCKRKKRNSQGSLRGGSLDTKNDHTALKKFKHRDSNVREEEVYQNMTMKDNLVIGAIANSGFTTLDEKRVDVQANPVYASEAVDKVNHYDTREEAGYATPDINKKRMNGDNFHPDSGYETPDLKRKEDKTAAVRSQYDTPEGDDLVADATYSIPDKTKREDDDGIKRVEINGDFYALPEKGNKKDDGLRYIDPSNLVSEDQGRNTNERGPTEPAQYADIVGVMKPKV